MNFTIMIPTRKRQHMLKDLLFSIYNTAVDKYNVETLVTYDNDDISTIEALADIKKICKDYPVKFFSRERHYSINNAYYNEMAQKATGEYLIAVNDDTIFTKKAWDIEGITKLNLYANGRPDKIFYGITSDMEVERARTQYNYFSCFPLLPRETVRVMGYFFDPDFFKDGADWDLVMPFRELKRVVDLRNEIEIQHISFRSGRRPNDLLDADHMLLPPPLQGAGPHAGKNLRRTVNYLFEYISNYDTLYKENKDAIFSHPSRTW